jgi:hypothetical protein
MCLYSYPANYTKPLPVMNLLWIQWPFCSNNIDILILLKIFHCYCWYYNISVYILLWLLIYNIIADNVTLLFILQYYCWYCKITDDSFNTYCWYYNISGVRGGVVVKALRYKPAGRGFDSRWCHWNFSVTHSFRSHYSPGVDPASNRN